MDERNSKLGQARCLADRGKQWIRFRKEKVFHFLYQKLYPTGRFKNLLMEDKFTDVFEETITHSYISYDSTYYLIFMLNIIHVLASFH